MRARSGRNIGVAVLSSSPSVISITCCGQVAAVVVGGDRPFEEAPTTFGELRVRLVDACCCRVHDMRVVVRREKV